jgi:hypothetical protein
VSEEEQDSRRKVGEGETERERQGRWKGEREKSNVVVSSRNGR